MHHQPHATKNPSNNVSRPPTAIARLVAALALTLIGTSCTHTTWAQTTPLEQQLAAEDVRDLEADSSELGDSARGAFLFHSPSLGCAKCHATFQETKTLGPDLAVWQRTVDDRHLIESVLHPSAKMEPPYQSRQIITADGRSLTGIEIARDDKTLTLRGGVGDADQISIELDNIELEKPLAISLMPTGQVNALQRRQDFLDLIAYLAAIRDGGRETAKRLQPSEESLLLERTRLRIGSRSSWHDR